MDPGHLQSLKNHLNKAAFIEVSLLPKISPERSEHLVFPSSCIVRTGQLSIFWVMKATREDLAFLIPGRVELEPGSWGTQHL